MPTLIVNVVEVATFYSYVVILSFVEEDSTLSSIRCWYFLLAFRVDQTLAELNSIHKLLWFWNYICILLLYGCPYIFWTAWLNRLGSQTLAQLIRTYILSSWIHTVAKRVASFSDAALDCHVKINRLLCRQLFSYRLHLFFRVQRGDLFMNRFRDCTHFNRQRFWFPCKQWNLVKLTCYKVVLSVSVKVAAFGERICSVITYQSGSTLASVTDLVDSVNSWIWTLYYDNSFPFRLAHLSQRQWLRVRLWIILTWAIKRVSFIEFTAIVSILVILCCVLRAIEKHLLVKYLTCPLLIVELKRTYFIFNCLYRSSHHILLRDSS